MTDMLLELSQNPLARKLVSSAKLPIPMPEKLARPHGPHVERFLEGESVVVSGRGALSDVIARTLARAGASTWVDSDALAGAFAAAAEAYGRPLQRLAADSGTPDKTKVHALLVDASSAQTPADLKPIYTFLHGQLPRIARSGRVVLLGRPSAQASSLAQAATAQALEGLTRSIAKEIGGKGATANLIAVAAGAEARLPAALRFFLSSASAFVTAQPLRVTADVAWDDQDPWERPLANKVALVTGAARGIGAATARALAREGAHVLCLDRPEDDEPLSIVARELGGTPILADVTDPSAAGRIADETRSLHGGLHVVVHNAGVTRDRTLARMPENAWDQVISINLEAILRITDSLIERGTLRDGGRVINLSSVSGIAGNMGQTNYAATKAGVIGFTRHLAQLVQGRGITVNAIAPGFIETRMTAAIPLVVREAGRRLSALGQGGQPEDVAEAITFLAQPGAAGITGQVLRVCGGALIGA
ncbi:MAG TPA: 3-oxoacyl-ACP reductase [Polyangiales bacterium]|nr:3-oxoacyl-ACP reductase [Polyangiales bacterium]